MTEINWRDLIDKSLVVELHGELHEVKVISALSNERWVRADQVTIMDTLNGDS